MIGIWDDSLTWDDTDIWQEAEPSTGLAIIGGATREYNAEETTGRVAMGGATSITVNRRSGVEASVLACCVTATTAAARCTFGGATWDASVESNADGLARYYPLWLDTLELSTSTVAALQSFGRDIAHSIESQGFGTMLASDNGKMCETPEQFRGGRWYSVPIDVVDPVQPEAGGRDADAPEELQWQYARDWTATMLVRRYDARQDQCLVALGDGLKFGLSWLGELSIEAILENGTELRRWSTQTLTTGQWSHVAINYTPTHCRVYLNGVLAVELVLTKPIATPEYFQIAQHAGGSLLWADVQDVRIYDHRKRVQFLLAESESYCADWIEVL